MKIISYIIIGLIITVSAINSQQDTAGSTKTDVPVLPKKEQPKLDVNRDANNTILNSQSTLPKDPAETSKSLASGGNVYPYRVIDVFSSGDRNLRQAGLDDEIIVKLDSLGLMLSRVDEKTGQLILYIDNYPLKGVNGIPDVSNNELTFRLSRVAAANENWNKVLSKPSFFSRQKPVTVSIGFENDRAIPVKNKDKNFTFVIVNYYWFWLCVIIIIILFLFLYWLGRNTEMLCEPYTVSENGNKRPYSLALTQMAFWYFLVVASIILLFLITREFPDLNSSVLILIGISSLTALSSTGINISRIKEREIMYISLEAEKKTLSESIAEIEKNISSKVDFTPSQLLEQQKDKEDKLKRLNEVIMTIPQYKKTNISYYSRGFFRDLVSDNTGVSLHRFQIAVWTLVLGFDFCYSVWSNLRMPEINNSLLALMGISSGTYIGFKIPEQKV